LHSLAVFALHYQLPGGIGIDNGTIGEPQLKVLRNLLYDDAAEYGCLEPFDKLLDIDNCFHIAPGYLPDLGFRD
jgi:hypothetical protein